MRIQHVLEQGVSALQTSDPVAAGEPTSPQQLPPAEIPSLDDPDAESGEISSHGAVNSDDPRNSSQPVVSPEVEAEVEVDGSNEPAMVGDVQRFQKLLESISQIYSSQDPGNWKGKEASHVPQAVVGTDGIQIRVEHGMSSDHFIPWIGVIDNEGQVIYARSISADDSAATLQIPPTMPAASASPYVPVAYCNRHGLWVGEPFESAEAADSADNNAERGNDSTPEADELPLKHPDLIEFEQILQSTDLVLTPDDPGPWAEKAASHTPRIVEVDVPGEGGEQSLQRVVTVTHPMQAADNGEQGHWIEMIAVLDSEGRPLLAHRFTGEESAPELLIPSDMPTELTPVAICNKHGLWKGPTFRQEPPEAGTNTLA